MGKSNYELASDITVAWINAMAQMASTSNIGLESKIKLFDKEQTAEFFKTVLETIQPK